MRILKLALILTLAGISCFWLAGYAAGQLPEAKTYSFPESLGRHYAKLLNPNAGVPVTMKHEFGGDVAGGDKHSPITSIDLETTALDVELVPTDRETIGVELTSATVDSKEPLLIDRTDSSRLKLIANEGFRRTHDGSVKSWIQLDFGDGFSQTKQAKIVVWVPKSVTNVKVRTTSGNLSVLDDKSTTKLSMLQFESKSGDLAIDSKMVEGLTVDTISGNVKSSTPINKINFHSVSGDLEADQVPAKADVAAKAISGDVTLHYGASPNAKLEFVTTSGDLNILGKEEATKIGKEIARTLGRGEGKVKVETVSGDLNVEATL